MSAVPDRVNRRPYTSPLREERAHATRQRILERAAEAFVEHGYARATIKRIAQAAEVSDDLVFHVFGNKRGLLEAVMARDAQAAADLSNLMSGTDTPELDPDLDPARRIQALAEAVGERSERTRPLDDMLRTAAVVDDQIAALRDRLHLEERRRAATEVVSALAEAAPLRQAEESAAALVWTLTSPEVHQMLVDGWGWSPEEYVAWLGDNLTTMLLEAPAADR